MFPILDTTVPLIIAKYFSTLFTNTSLGLGLNFFMHTVIMVFQAFLIIVRFTTYITNVSLILKVEKILKGSLESITSPSPSMKIQSMGRKVCLRCKGKTLLGVANKHMKIKKFVDTTQQCFALLPQVNFPDNNLNFH